MRLNNLQLINFRNYDNLHLNFKRNINLLVGKNGQGKTNIVEAIYMLSFGKSFRTNKDKEIIKFGSENLYIGGNYLKNSSKGLIEVAIGNNKKGIKVNKIHIHKIQELLGNLNVVIFSPEDLKLVKDGPRERRSFIDKEISQIMPKYYNYLVNYNKILIQRNKTLKNRIVDENLLSVYDESLANYGAYIYVLRRDFIKKIAKISNEMHKKLTGNNEELLITYKNQINLTDEDTVKDAKDKLLSKLESNRQRDIETRMTKYGIHKDDLNIFINDLDVKLYGSQGQQRTASISLKLSEIELIKQEVNDNPVLILDTVFMGAEDIERQKLNVFRMEMLGAKVQPVTTGSATLKDATNEAIRTWAERAEDTFYIIGSAVGPHPYPKMVKEFQRIISTEARKQILDKTGKLPDAVVACVGGGSNSIGMFADFINDKDVDLIGVEAGGLGIETGKHASAMALGQVGVLHGMKTYLLQDEIGNIQLAHSISAGLDYPGVGPEHAYLRDSGRAKYVSVTDKECMDALMELCRMEGIIPAIESAHALAHVFKMAQGEYKGKTIIMCLSGRGDKDVNTVQKYLNGEETNK